MLSHHVCIASFAYVNMEAIPTDLDLRFNWNSGKEVVTRARRENDD